MDRRLATAHDWAGLSLCRHSYAFIEILTATASETYNY